MKRAIRLGVLLLLSLGWVLGMRSSGPFAPLAAQAQGGRVFYISEVDSSKFPRVSFRLRVVDSQANRVVTGLTDRDIAIYENGVQQTGVTVSAQNTGPVFFTFLIDQGRSHNYNAFGNQNSGLLQAVSDLVNGGAFQPGDQILLAVQSNFNASNQTVTVFGPDGDGQKFINFVNSSNVFSRRSTGNTKGLEGVDATLQQLKQLISPAGSQAGALIVISRFIEDPQSQTAVTAATGLAQDALASNILVYALQTDKSLNAGVTAPLQTLAVTSGGLHTQSNNSDLALNAQTIYQDIVSQRQYYVVEYDSSTGQDTQRTITLNSANPVPGIEPGAYEIKLEAPVVEIQAPLPSATITRNPLSNGGYDRSSVDVIARVSFPDQRERDLVSAELVVNGEPQGTVAISQGTTEIRLKADLTNFTTVGTNQLNLEVRVVDVLGFEASATNTVVVDVVALPTPEPTATPAPPTTVWVLGGLVACAIVFLAIAVFGLTGYTIFRPRTATPAASGGARPSAAAAEMQATLIGGIAYQDKVLATLTVIEGPKGLVGEAIRVIKQTSVLGRNPSRCDITFYAEEESSVSRTHATLQKDGESFKLTDNGSSSGTRLNGRQIRPNDPVILQAGDEIVLGDLARRGVKLRFDPASSSKGRSRHSGSADDRTMIMDAPDDDQFDKYSE
ncbi:MAG TPA: FHA domain-containing protein [Anaerolineales bacterium]|nr:FHA domain-containing protein [Anaerolineales bacterium]